MVRGACCTLVLCALACSIGHVYGRAFRAFGRSQAQDALGGLKPALRSNKQRLPVIAGLGDWGSKVVAAAANTDDPAGVLAARRKIYGACTAGSLSATTCQDDQLLRFFANSSAAAASHNQKNLSIFLHFSKAGGTLMCDVATHNCAEGQVPEDNCWHTGDGPMWCPMSRVPKQLSCEQRALKATKNGFRFMAVERYMDAGPPCPQFRYITLLREPIGRAKSMIKHQMTLEGGSGGDENGGGGAGETGQEEDVSPCLLDARVGRGKGLHVSAKKVLKLQPAYFNNFYVRSLLGPAVHALPLGGVTHEHLQQAKMLLSHSFDLVLLRSQQCLECLYN
jgi:hypothetical protein